MNTAIWITAVASLIAVVLNIRKHRACFAIWLVTNLSWTVIDFRHGIYGQACLQAVYAGLSVWGLLQWRRDHEKSQENNAHECKAKDAAE